MLRLFARLGLAAALLLVPIAAHATIGAPTVIGSNKIENATTTSLVFTTNVNINAGDFVFCTLTTGTGGNAPSSVVDSGAVNAWTRVTVSATAPTEYYAYVANASAVASGGTITFNYASTGGRKALGCVSVTGIVTASPLDGTATSTSNTGTSTSATTINSGALAQNVEVLFAGINGTNGTDFGTFTPPGSWVQILSSTSANGAFRICYQIVSTNSTVAWSPAWGTSTQFRSWAVVGFKGLTASGLTLMGMGP